MTKRELVLAALSTSDGGPWTPVQVQKLFFLLDQKAARQLGGPHWNFTPYDYGPFDSAVYTELETLAVPGLVRMGAPGGGVRQFALTEAGQRRGAELLGALPGAVGNYIRELGLWVRSLSFKELVSAIYRDFPDMKANSIFRE